MKGFFSWFKSENKIKRWIFLILFSMIAICYAISKIIVTDNINIKDIAQIIILFVLGVICIVFGIVSIQKRTLEILVKETDKRDNVKSLIYDKKVYNQGPKIVVIGGGTGLNSVLRGLKTYTENITAIVTISDYGEQKSDSRILLDTLPLDEIKQSLIALSSEEEEMNNLLNYQFKEGNLKDLSFGDIYLLAMQNLYSDFSKSIKQSKNILNITGKVLPVTMDEIDICAELKDGTTIKGKSDIPDVINEKVSSINRVYISPTNCKAAPGVIQAIKDADAIIIGPGSLYTNVIPNLLVKGISTAIKESKGFKVYVSNIMTEPGQTYNYSLADHIKAIKRHIGEGIIDYCIYDTGEVTPEYIRRYNMMGSELVDQDLQKAKAEGVKLIKRDLAKIEDGFIRHNPDAIAKSIIELICEDLKFKDKQNDPEYLILNQKLKHKKVSTVPKNRQKRKKIDKSGKSKFYSKYEDRIISIRESDEKLKQKLITEKGDNSILEKIGITRQHNIDKANKMEVGEREKNRGKHTFK